MFILLNKSIEKKNKNKLCNVTKKLASQPAKTAYLAANTSNEIGNVHSVT